MKENSTIVFIDGKEFFVDNISIDENGKVIYDVYCKEDMTQTDFVDVDNFVKKLLKVR